MTKTKILISLLALLVLIILFQLPWPKDTNKTHPVIIITDSLNKAGRIIFISDTQDPIWVETFVLEENQNFDARNKIFEKIVDEKPEKVFHLGDLVALGYYDEDWKPIDQFLGKLIKDKIEFYPTLGNHELMIFSEMGEENFNNRFPFYSKTGYSINNGATEIILLNSNFSEMTANEIAKQQKWYVDKLIQLDQDSTISAVVVGCHHSPFTNSKIVNPDEQVEKFFVSPFLEFSKCKLFLSGHCHAFEHFRIKDKDFLVIGGGGGLQQPLYTGEEEKWDDLYGNGASKRMFHFIEYELQPDTIKVSLKMLTEDLTQFEGEYVINIAL